jgi:tetratricopeptide (TPR) repeat protein
MGREIERILTGEHRQGDKDLVDRFVAALPDVPSWMQKDAYRFAARARFNLGESGKGELALEEAGQASGESRSPQETLIRIQLDSDRSNRIMIEQDLRKAGTWIAEKYRWLGDDASAEAALVRALRFLPSSEPVLQDLVSLELDLGRLKPAEEYAGRLLEAAEKETPLDVMERTINNQVILSEERPYTDLEEHLRFRLSRPEEASRFEGLVIEDRAAALESLVRVFAAEGRQAEALDYAKRLIGLRAKGPAGPLSGAYLVEMGLLARSGDWTRALADLLNALRTDPAHFKDAVQQSEDWFEHRKGPSCAVFDPSGSEPSRLRAELLVLRGLCVAPNDRSAAKTDFETAVRTDPEAACTDDFVEVKRGRVDPLYFTACLDRYPESARLHLDRGVSLAQRRRLDEALADFRRAVGLKPDYPEAELSLATALLMKDHRTEAAAVLDAAIRLAQGRDLPIDRMIREYRTSLPGKSKP